MKGMTSNDMEVRVDELNLLFKKEGLANERMLIALAQFNIGKRLIRDNKITRKGLSKSLSQLLSRINDLRLCREYTTKALSYAEDNLHVEVDNVI